MNELIASIRPMAVRNPSQHTQKEDFERILEGAKRYFSGNDVIRNMDSGPGRSITAIDLIQKLTIMRSAIEAKEGMREEGKPEWEEPED